MGKADSRHYVRRFLLGEISGGNANVGGIAVEEMKDYVLSPQALVVTSGSSVGTQKKYYDNGYWYKQNNLGYEGSRFQPV